MQGERETDRERDIRDKQGGREMERGKETRLQRVTGKAAARKRQIWGEEGRCTRDGGGRKK